MQKVQLLKFDCKQDARGKLCVLEVNKNIPFIPQRMFYLTDTKDSRGGHANKYSNFLFVVMKGSVKIKSEYMNEVEDFLLTQNDFNALYMQNMVWKSMYDFSEDCVLCVLSDTLYDANEYINDKKLYNEMILGEIQ